MKQMIKGLDKLISEQMEQNQDFGKKTIDLGTQKEEIELVEQLWKKISAEVEALRVEIQAPGRVTTEEPAFATKRDSLGMKAALGSGFGGFGLVLLGISSSKFPPAAWPTRTKCRKGCSCRGRDDALRADT